MSDLQKLLKSINACSEAAEWVGKRDLIVAWAECERADWMLWLCGKMVGKKGWPTRQEVVQAACACARTSLKFVKAGEERPRIAIETAEKWARGQAPIEEVRAVANAAYAAAAYADADAYAAYAYADADAAYAYAAAAAYAYAAAYAAAAYADAAAADAAADADAAAAYADAAAAYADAAAADAAADAAKKNALKDMAEIVRGMLTPGNERL